MSIPQTFIQELLTRTDVVEVVARYVKLKKGGANFMGLCPFHTEKSPSFSVSPAKQFYHCFGCNKNGNAISFLMECAGLGFVEAVHELARQAGLPVPEQTQSSEAERAQAVLQREQQHSLTEILEQAAKAYQQQLRQSPQAVAYLKQRGLSGLVAQRFGLGYAAPGWHGLASVFPHYDDPLLEQAGLVILSEPNGAGEQRRYDRFRDRIMFPIRNVKGDCIGFGARVLGDDKPKYLNSPETPVFSKGRELYGLFEARPLLRQAGYVLVVEGYMDVVALAQLGFAQAVATLGTACTPEHLNKLFRHSDAVVFGFDGDAAGRQAARKALEVALPYASDTRSIKFLFLPPEHDPDSFIRAFGAAAFAEQVAAATPLSRFLQDSASDGCDPGSAEGRARLASQAQPLWSALPDGVLKRQLLGELAALVKISAPELLAHWQRSAANSATTLRRREPVPPGSRQVRASVPRQQPTTRADHAARLLLSYRQAWEGLSGEEHGLLCALPEPHGALFAWLESQYHEYGTQPWSALREALRGHACEPLALRLMAEPGSVAELPAQEWRQELRDVLNRLLIEQLKTEENQALAAAASDPQALQHYRALQSRRRLLESAPALDRGDGSRS